MVQVLLYCVSTAVDHLPGQQRTGWSSGCIWVYYGLLLRMFFLFLKINDTQAGGVLCVTLHWDTS